MFPQSLHKNIRELDKQISLLESECENMETDKRKRGIISKIYVAKQKDAVALQKKAVKKESVERPFYTAPRTQETRLVKKTSKTLSTTTVCPRSSLITSKTRKPATTRETSTTTSEEQSKGRKGCPMNGIGSERPQTTNRNYMISSDCACNRTDQDHKSMPENCKGYDLDTEKHVLHKGVLHANPGGTIEVTVVQKLMKTPSSTCKGTSKSIALVKNGGGEKSDSDSCIMKENQKLSDSKFQQRISPASPKWSEILCQGSDIGIDKKNKVNNRNNNIRSSYSLGSKCLNHYDVEPKKHASAGDTHLHVPNLKLNKCDKELLTDMWNDENVYPQSTVSTAQRIPRPKSPFRRKNVENVIDASPRTLGSFEEKGIQCGGDEKSCFSDESFDPLRTMCNLIDALKGNFTGEETKKLLNDLESSLLKLTDEPHTKNSVKDKMEYVYECRKEDNEYVKKLQKHFLSTKKLCDKLTKERNKLSEDLAVKEQLLAAVNAKEKEYISTITNLKVNLEKKRVLADENLEALKELNVVRNKLMNEIKVTEALRRSHAKMQEQIQKCVLENDKLKTEIRLNKLESQKFCVLLAGKDAEIKRYKDEVEAFQRQITNQLVALRSNNAANEVQKAMEAIMKQSQAFSVTDWDSAFSETQSDKEAPTSSKQRERLIHSSPTSTNSSLTDSWNHISSIHGDDTKSNNGAVVDDTANEVYIGDLRPGGGSSGDSPDDENAKEPKPQSFVSCKSADDLTHLNVLSGSEAGCKESGEGMTSVGANNRLRENIGELFEELKMKCSQRIFSLPSDSVIFEDLLNSSGTSDTSDVSAGFLATLEKNGRL